MPPVELLRPIHSERVETNWLSDQVGVSKLTCQDEGADPPILELGKDEQFVEKNVIVVLR